MPEKHRGEQRASKEEADPASKRAKVGDDDVVAGSHDRHPSQPRLIQAMKKQRAEGDGDLVAEYKVLTLAQMRHEP